MSQVQRNQTWQSDNLKPYTPIPSLKTLFSLFASHVSDADTENYYCHDVDDDDNDCHDVVIMNYDCVIMKADDNIKRAIKILQVILVVITLFQKVIAFYFWWN